MSATGAANFVNNLVAVFPVHFGPQSTENEKDEYKRKRESWMRSLIAELRHVEDVDLEQAASEIKQTRKDRRFPTVAECLTACRVVAKRREPDKQRLQFEEQLEKPFMRYSRLADDLLNTEQARRAAREGWILSFWTFVRDHGRAPSPHDETALRRAAEGFDRAFEDCLRGGFPLAGALAKLGSSLHARREALRIQVLGEGR